MRGDTSRGGARPKTRSYASVLSPSKGEVVPLGSYSHSGRYLLTSDPVQELLSDIDVKTDLNLSRTQKKSGLPIQQRTDGEPMRGNTSRRARRKRHSYSRPTQFSMDKGACSNSERNALKIGPAEKILSEIDEINNMDVKSKLKIRRCHEVIKNTNIHDFTTEDTVHFIKKIILWKPFFKDFSWTIKSIFHRKLRGLGIFFEIKEEIRCVQIELIKSLISEINIDCRVNSILIKSIGLSSLLSDIKHVISHELLIELHSEVKSMAIEILTVISSGKINFLENAIGGALAGIVRLIKTNNLSPNDDCVKGSVGFLLKCIVEEKSKFKYYQLENIVVDIKLLVEFGVMKDTNIRDISDAVILILPYIILHIEQPNKKQICLFLGVMSLLAEKSLKEKRRYFDEIFEILVRAIPNESNKFTCTDMVIIFHSLSFLLNNNFTKLDELLYRKAIDSLNVDLGKKIDICDTTNICMLIQYIGKIIYFGVDYKINDLFEKLVDIAPKKISGISFHNASILLGGIGRVTSNTCNVVFNDKFIENVTEIYYLVAHCVTQNIPHISIENLAILLCSYGQLIEYNLVQGEPLRLELSLKLLVDRQLNYLLNVKGNLINLNTALVTKTIFGMTKMLHYVPYIDKALIDEFFVKFITLLFGRESEITMINTCKLISSIGKLVSKGAKWTEDVENFTYTLIDNIIHQDIKEIESIWPSTMLPMLNSLAVIGLRFGNLKDLLRMIMRSNIIDQLTSNKHKSLMLSSLSYFYSWYDEDEPLKNDLRQVMLFLVAEIDRIFLECKLDNYPSIIMRYAKFWLGIHDENININYNVSTSNMQKNLLSNLRERYPFCEITSEVSIDNLPPVDIAFLKYMLLIEIDGFQHFLDDNKRIFAGKCISKMKAYTSIGFTVISVPILYGDVHGTLDFLSLYDKIDTHIAKYHSIWIQSISHFHAPAW